MPPSLPLLITGASSQVGGFLVPRLVAAGLRACLFSRAPRAGAEISGVRWVAWDINQSDRPMPAEFAGEALIHLAPLRLLPALLPEFFARGGKRVIAFSTTSRDSKAGSADPRERAYARALADAEAAVARLCEQAGVAWTLFRPTLIYGAGRDRNVAVIARLIRYCSVFPLLGEARGLRQPVHADDLAAACVAALDNPATFNRAYELAGGETLQYREMVSRIFLALGKRPRFVPVPLAAFSLAMRVFALCPHYRDFSAEMARRMNQDMVFDYGAAARDFGYCPRPFSPQAACIEARR